MDEKRSSNADLIAILLAKYDQEKLQARRHEELRASTTNFIIAISAGVLAFLGDGDSENRFMAGIFLIILGVFGAFLSRKHYERFRYHSRFARAYDAKLGQIVSESKLENIGNLKSKHHKRFSIMKPVKLNWLWISINLFIALIGLFLISGIDDFCDLM